MKANELRIGNFIEVVTFPNLGSCEVRSILGYYNKIEVSLKNTKYKKDYPFMLNLDTVIPTPITEEWLLKFGFEKSNNKYYSEYIMFRFFKNGNVDIKILGQINDGIKKNLKYVHQLQNLYFALSGEELQIK